VYTAASAFSGTYKVSAKHAFGRSIGGKASIRVTRFKGTPNEHVDQFDVQVDGKPIEIKLDGGSRTALADVSDELDLTAELRGDTTGSALTGGVSGLGGGFGTAGSALASPVTTTGGPALPLVAGAAETRVPGISSNTADIRATFKMNPDRKTYSVTVNPVFAGKGDIAMPKVPLLPGGEGK
jgi:hypothetical protein